MATVDDLIGDLSAGGELDTEGAFSIDRDKAREKLRQFQLADPRRYVLLLVQAAVHKGATRIEFEIDADDMRLRFDGREFDRSDIEELYTSLFGDRSDARLRARQELALALNAAMALNPRHVRLRSAQGRSGVKAELRPDRPDSIETIEIAEHEAQEHAFTEIHVKERFRPGLIVQFFRDLDGSIAEEKILRQYCRFTQVPVFLDGKPISGGPRIEGECLVKLEVTGEHVRGQVGFVDGLDGRSYMHLLVAGVWLTTHALPGFPRNFRAVVDATDLRKDVSQADVVRDEAYERLIGILHAAAHDAVGALLGVFDRGETLPSRVCTWAAAPAWLLAMCREELVRFGAIADVELHGNSIRDRLAAVRLWSTLGGRWLSTREVLELGASIHYVTTTYEDSIPAAWRDAILLVEDEPRAQFLALFERHASDQTKAVARDIERDKLRLAFRARTHASRLGEGLYRGRAVIDTETLRGEVALRAYGSESPTLQLVVDGCLLEEIHFDVDEVPLRGLVAVVEGPFRPTVDWNRAHRDDAFGEALLVVLRAAQELMANEAARVAEHERLAPEVVELLLPYVHAVATGSLDDAFLRHAGLGKAARSRLTSRVGPTRRDAIVFEGEQIDPLARLRLFEDVTGSALSLATVAQRARDGVVRIVSTTRPRMDDPPFLVLRLKQRPLDILKACLGEKRIELFGVGYDQLMREREWMARPEVGVRLPEPSCVPPVRFEHDARVGMVGVRRTTDAMVEPSAQMCAIEVLKRNRTLCTLNVRSPLPLAMAAINHDLLAVNASWSDIGNASDRRAIEEAFHFGLGVLVAVLVERHLVAPLDQSLRRVLLAAASVPFDWPAWLEGYVTVRDEQGVEEARRRLGLLADLHDELRGQLDAELTREILFGAGVAPPAAKQKRKRAKQAKLSKLAPLRKSFLAKFEAIAKAPLLATVSGMGSIADVLAEIAEHRTVFHVSEAPRDVDDLPRLVLVLPKVERVLLERLVGTSRLRPGEEWLDTWRRQNAFERRKPLESLAVTEPVLARVALGGAGGIEGELAIPALDPALAEPRARVCCRRRPIATVKPDLEVPLVAVVSGPTFGQSSRFEGIDHMESVRIDAICRSHVGALQRELAARWSGLEDQFAVARKWVIRFLADGAAKTAAEPNRLHGPLHALAGLPVFIGLDGKRISLIELGRALRTNGRLMCVAGGRAVPPSDELVVSVQDDAELGALRAIFGEVADYEQHLDEAEAVRKRKASAPRMSAPPADALAVVDVRRRGLEGKLWLDAYVDEHTEVAFGQDGRVAGRAVVSEIFPCAGAVQGSGVRIDAKWESFELKSRQRDFLRERAVALYQSLLERYTQAIAEGEEQAERSFLGALENRIKGHTDTAFDPTKAREVLRGALLRMHAERRRGGKWSDGKYRRMHHALSRLPLIEVASGHRISLATARKERSMSLAHLGLWDDDEPEDTSPESESESESESEAEAVPVPPVQARVEAEPPPPPEPAPRSEPEREPEPPPPPPPPTAEELLVEAVRAELRLIRRANEHLLSEGLLDAIAVGACGSTALAKRVGPQVLLDPQHPVTAAALRDPERARIEVSLVASAVYTAINAWLEEVTDGDERLFHRLHAELLAR